MKRITFISIFLAIITLISAENTTNKGKLLIEVYPDNAQIKIDGIIEKNRQIIELEPRDYMLSISLDQHESIMEMIKINAGDEIKKVYHLKKITSQLNMEINPETTNIEIFSNDSLYYQTTGDEKSVKLPFGAYHLIFTHENQIRELDIVIDKAVNRIALNMTDNKPKAKVRFFIKPVDSKVYITNDQEKFFLKGDGTVYRIPYGEYRLNLANNYYLTQNISLKINDSLEVFKYRLRPDYRPDYSLIRIKGKDKSDPNTANNFLFEKRGDYKFLSIPLLYQGYQDNLYIGILSDIKIDFANQYSLINLGSLGVMAPLINRRDFQFNAGAYASLGIQTPYSNGGYKLRVKRYSTGDDDEEGYFYDSGVLFTGSLNFETGCNVHLKAFHLILKGGYSLFGSQANSADWYQDHEVVHPENVERNVLKDSHPYFSIGVGF